MAEPNTTYVPKSPRASLPVPPDRHQYREALVEIMAKGVQGVVTINMAMPPHLPPAARIPASVIAGAGFAGLQAFRSIWDGAMGRPLVEPPFRGPIEDVISDTITASALGTTMSVAIGRTVPSALRIGGRIGVAVAAGDAAAEAVRELADAAYAGSLGERAREWFGEMQTAGTARLSEAGSTAYSVVEGVRSGVRDLSAAAAGSIDAATEFARSLRDTLRDRLVGPLVGPGPSPPRERALPKRLTAQEQAENAVRRALERRREEAPGLFDGEVRVQGFERTRRIPGSGQTVREYVRPYIRHMA